MNLDLCRELTELQLENKSLKAAEDQLSCTRKRMYSLNRNKLQRRDKTIAAQTKELDDKSSIIEQLHHKVVRIEPQIKQLMLERDRIRHRATYWRQQVDDLKSLHDDQQISELVKQRQTVYGLTEEVAQLEHDNLDLRETIDEIMATSSELVTFHGGKYTDSILACCYELLSLNVGVKQVVPVIKSVLGNLTEKKLGRMPSKALLRQHDD